MDRINSSSSLVKVSYETNPNNLGVVASSYSMGSPDFWKARAYFELAIEQGKMEGQFNLIKMYEFGQGYIINDDHKNLYIEAAKRIGLSDGTIHYTLGVSYLTGDGADMNPEIARTHLMEAYLLKHPKAEQLLFKLDETGVRLPPPQKQDC